jgi:hypothetical protein
MSTFIFNERRVSFSIMILAGLIVIGCREEVPVYPDVTRVVSPEAAQSLSDQLTDELPIELAEGLTISLWASDTLVEDPVAISIDNWGNIFYTNARRPAHSEFDIRGYQHWMTPSIIFESVEDRRKFLRETLSPDKSSENEWLEDLNQDGSHDWRDLTVEKERV